MFTFGCLPSPPDPRDYIYRGPRTRSLTEDPLPVTFDMRPDLPSIRDQGTQGSCVAQASSAMKEWQEKKQISYRDHLSPQFIYNMRTNYPQDGMYCRDAMDILLKYGVSQELVFPYGSRETSTQIASNVFQDATNFKVKSYASVPVGDMNAVKTALVHEGPCVITFDVYNYGMEFWKQNSGDQLLGGHAVSVVGWTENAFIIRNSWGTRWGNEGYTFYSFTDFDAGYHGEIWATVDDLSHVVIPPQPKCACGGGQCAVL